jgi:alpha-1,6-mannosyltransferase
MPIRDSFKAVSLSVFMVIGLAIISFVIERSDSLILISAYSLMWIGYLVLIKLGEDFGKYLFGLGLILRVLLLFALPVLSDDFYRFIWDGKLLMNGENPFEHLPADYLNQGLEGIDSELYNRLNSPEYFAIYPPVNQFVFWVAASVSGDNLLLAVNLMRAPILLADIGIYILLKKWNERKKLSSNIALLYFLNPLVILELTGNLHFEGVMMFFVLLGIVGFQSEKHIKGAISWTLAICSKLLPLMYLPTLLVYTKWRKVIISYSLIAVITLVLFLPLFSLEFIKGLSSSVGLYFQKFEFNASIYFLVREIGFWITGYNQIAEIGPALALATLCLILLFNFWAYKRNWSLPFTLLAIHTLYLMMATTVHPWYVVSLICLSCLTQSRFAIVWSFLIFLTYLGYTNTGFELPAIVIWVEYVVVFSLVIIEIKGKDQWLRKLLAPKPV